MNIAKFIYPSIALSLALSCANIFADEIAVRSPNGTFQTIYVDHHETFHNVIDRLEYQFNNDPAQHQNVLYQQTRREFILDFMSRGPLESDLLPFGLPRDYSQNVTSEQKSDISFIITTLGMSSLVKIGKSKSKLKSAGNRVDRVHPLRFLQTVFTDEKMKAGIYNMQSRGWIWGEFIDGIKKSASTEFAQNNFRPDQIQEFASIVGIDQSLLQPLAVQQNWTKFVTTLIDKIPRKENKNDW